jgi:hypothetical protein
MQQEMSARLLLEAPKMATKMELTEKSGIDLRVSHKDALQSRDERVRIFFRLSETYLRSAFKRKRLWGAWLTQLLVEGQALIRTRDGRSNTAAAAWTHER